MRKWEGSRRRNRSSERSNGRHTIYREALHAAGCRLECRSTGGRGYTTTRPKHSVVTVEDPSSSETTDALHPRKPGRVTLQRHKRTAARMKMQLYGMPPREATRSKDLLWQPAKAPGTLCSLIARTGGVHCGVRRSHTVLASPTLPKARSALSCTPGHVLGLPHECGRTVCVATNCGKQLPPSSGNVLRYVTPQHH